MLCSRVPGDGKKASGDETPHQTRRVPWPKHRCVVPVQCVWVSATECANEESKKEREKEREKERGRERQRERKGCVCVCVCVCVEM
jgi:hypothetical protein